MAAAERTNNLSQSRKISGTMIRRSAAATIRSWNGEYIFSRKGCKEKRNSGWQCSPYSVPGSALPVLAAGGHLPVSKFPE